MHYEIIPLHFQSHGYGNRALFRNLYTRYQNYQSSLLVTYLLKTNYFNMQFWAQSKSQLLKSILYHFRNIKVKERYGKRTSSVQKSSDTLN